MTYSETLDFAVGQVRSLIERHPGLYPMYTHQGRWKHDLPAWTHWCDGFLPGIMWILLVRGDESWREPAIRYTKPLEPRQFDRDVHDLGFIFMSTYRRWLDLEPNPSLDDVLIQAGRTLALRFREKGRYLRSFVAEESLFIDIMMNVGIIFYAAQRTGDQRLLDIATQHCLTTRRVLVRADGSTAHEGIFDLETGEFLRQSTHQGYRGDSCWSRGLAWALYGFHTAYEYTKDPRFFRTAELCAEFYLAQDRPVPPWDYDAPAESRAQADTSAAAIAAAGLLRMGHTTYARRILDALCRDHVGGTEGILNHGVYHIHKGLGVNESVMWGDYFFVEALALAEAAK